MRVLLCLGLEPPPFLLWMIERAEGQEPRITEPFWVGRQQFQRKLFLLMPSQLVLEWEP